MAEQLERVMGAGDEVFLTGAGGFVGSHVRRALLEAHDLLRALVRPGSGPLPPLDGCTAVWGDVLRPGDLVQHMVGCRYLVHVAALYSFSPGMRHEMFATNVRGCAGVLEAAHLAGIERAVITSSSSTVGPSYGGRPATGDDWDVEAASSPHHPSNLQHPHLPL